MKTCRRCGKEKSLEEFYKDKNGGQGAFIYCKKCDNERHLDYYKRNPDHNKNKHLRHRFGLSIEKREEMLSAQGGVCLLCGIADPGARGWQIDHDHNCCPANPENDRQTCGKCVRGLLCVSCNKGLGDFKDDPRVLLAAVSYLSIGAIS